MLRRLVKRTEDATLLLDQPRPLNHLWPTSVAAVHGGLVTHVMLSSTPIGHHCFGQRSRPGSTAKPFPPIQPLGPDIYTVPLFSEDGCHRLCQELHAFETWSLAHQVDVSQPNSMHQYGLVLAQIKMQPALQSLVSSIESMWTNLYPEVGSDAPDGFHSF